MNALLLGGLLTDLRDAIEDAYDTFDTAPAKPHVTVWHGLTPPHDCRNRCWVSYEVVQRVATASSSTGFAGSARCAVIPQVRFRVEIAREWPGEANAKKEEEAALLLDADATTLWYGLAQKNFDSTLFPSWRELNCENVRFEDMRPREPLGLLAGWVWRITVDLMGHTV